MNEQEFYIGITANQKELTNVKNAQNKLYTRFADGGMSYETPYSNNPLSDMPWTTASPTKHTATKKTNLFDQMKEGADVTSKALNELAKAQTEANKIQQDLVRATENMGVNIFASVLTIATELTQGNKLKSIDAQTNALVGETQINKNIHQKDYYEFQNKGIPELVDSHGDPIKPAQAKAVANAENAIANKFKNTGKIGDTQLQDTEGKDVVPTVVEAQKNAEQHIETKDMNSSTIDDLMEFIPEFLGSATDDLTSVLGGDGFDINLNPFKEVQAILEKDLEAELEKIDSEV